MFPPTNDDEVLRLILATESHYANLRPRLVMDDRCYDGDLANDAYVPVGFDITIPSTGRAIVDEAVDNVVPQDFKAVYHPRGKGTKWEEAADAVRIFCRAYFRELRERMMDIDPVRAFAEDICRHGKGALKIYRDDTLWPSLDPDLEKSIKRASGRKGLEEARERVRAMRKRGLPWLAMPLSPHIVMEDPTPRQHKLWAVERYEADNAEVRGLYERYLPDEDFMQRLSHTVHELWTASHIDEHGTFHEGQHYILVDNVVVHQEPNYYDTLPIAIKYSGMGRKGRTAKPEEKAVGFYTPQVRSLLLAEVRRYSQIDAILAQLAFPIGIIPQEIADINFNTEPGAINVVPQELVSLSDKMFIKVPIPDAEYLNSLNVISSQIERGSTQQPLRGSAVPGTDSAAQLSQYIGQAQLRLGAIRQAIEGALSWFMSEVLRRIDEDGETVVIPLGDETGGEISLGPDQIAGHYDVRIEMMPNEEQIKERKLALANDAIVKGGFAPYDALEYAGFDDPARIVARRRAHDVLNEPEVRRALGKQWLREAGIEADVLAGTEQIEQAALQMMVRDLVNQLQVGSMGAVPGTPGPQAPGLTPGPGMLPPGQDPMAALAQMGQGPMPMPQGAPPQDPALLPPQAMQRGPM